MSGSKRKQQITVLNENDAPIWDEVSKSGPCIEPIVLPEGWTTARIGDVLHLINGAAFKPTDWTETGMPIIRIQNLNNPNAPFNRCSKELPEKLRVRSGDLLFAWSGTPGTSFGAHIWKGPEAWLNQHIFRVEFDRELFDLEFLRLAINRNLDEYIQQAHGGAGLAHITKGRFEASTLVVPPVAEQRRIMARLEALEARSRRARAALDAIPSLLAQGRQSLLAAAFRGDLTIDWRDSRGSSAKADHPSPEDDAETAWPIPNSWKATCVNNLIPKGGLFDGPFGSHLKSDDYTAAGARVIRLENIGHLQFNDEKRTFVSLEKYGTLKRHAVTGGDIIFASFIFEPLRVCILPPLDTRALAKADCFCVRPNEELVDRAYLCYQLACPGIGHQLADLVHGATRPRINTTQLRDVPVAWCPLAEQHEIVRRLDAAFARLDAAAAAHAAAVAELDRLDASLLAKAFRGELVPQDPTEEPAEVTLKRLRTPRENSEPFAYLFQFLPALLRASEGALPFTRALEGCALLRMPRDLIRLLEPIGGAPARQHFERFTQPVNDGSFVPILRELITAGAITHNPHAGHMLRLVESKAPPIAPLIEEDARHVASVLALVPNEALEALMPRHTRKLCPNPTVAALAF